MTEVPRERTPDLEVPADAPSSMSLSRLAAIRDVAHQDKDEKTLALLGEIERLRARSLRMEVQRDTVRTDAARLAVQIGRATDDREYWRIYANDRRAEIDGLVTERDRLASIVGEVRKIYDSAKGVAEHGAFIRRDPYEMTEDLGRVLGVDDNEGEG